MNKLNGIVIVFFLMGCMACNQPATNTTDTQTDWKQQLNKELPLLGHRNWILVVDKAFPAQSSAGMEVFNTNEDLLPVLKYTLGQINSSTHVKPIIFTDKEINYITESQSPGVGNYKTQLKGILGTLPVQSLLHDSVFTKMDASSKLFKVLVLKTNQTLAYSSVLIQLDCAYWNADKEKQLRAAMKNNQQ